MLSFPIFYTLLQQIHCSSCMSILRHTVFCLVLYSLEFPIYILLLHRCIALLPFVLSYYTHYLSLSLLLFYGPCHLLTLFLCRHLLQFLVKELDSLHLYTYLEIAFFLFLFQLHKIFLDTFLKNKSLEHLLLDSESQLPHILP